MEEYEQLLVNETEILEHARMKIDKLRQEVSQITFFWPIVGLASISSIAGVIISLVLYLVARDLFITLLYTIFGLVLSGFLVVVLTVIWWGNFKLLSNIEDERRIYSAWIMARRRIDDITLKLILRERKE